MGLPWVPWHRFLITITIFILAQRLCPILCIKTLKNIHRAVGQQKRRGCTQDTPISAPSPSRDVKVVRMQTTPVPHTSKTKSQSACSTSSNLYFVLLQSTFYYCLVASSIISQNTFTEFKTVVFWMTWTCGDFLGRGWRRRDIIETRE